LGFDVQPSIGLLSTTPLTLSTVKTADLESLHFKASNEMRPISHMVY